MLEYLSISTVALVVSLFVYAKNPSGALHRNYLFFTLMNIIWLSGVVLAWTPDDFFELHFRILFFAAACMAFFLLMFVSHLVQQTRSLKLRLMLLSGNLAVLLLSLFTDLITRNVVITEQGDILPERGILYVPALMWVFGLGFASVMTIVKKLRSQQVSREKLLQIKIVLAALVLAVVTATLTNVVLPIVTSSTTYSNFAPLSMLFITLGLGYAIFRHGLFDIKLTVARGVVYIASTATLVLIYIFTVTVLISSNVLSADVPFAQRLLFVLVAVLSAFTFTPIKRFFDKQTSKIFYRDSYDPQVFIDQLNKSIVNSFEIEALLTKCALLIQETFKANYCTFYIRENAYFPSRIIGAHRDSPEILDIESLEKNSKKLRKKVHSVDYTVGDNTEETINEILKKNDFEVMIRLVNTLDYEVEGVGFVFLGSRKSGSHYTEKDLKILEIVANELVIAIENVLRFEEIEQFNVTLQKKIDEATKELKQSNDKLRALDEAKDEFVSMASHQLRTPLTSIKGFLSMVLEGDAGEINKTQKDMLGQAFFSSQRMVYLISDLLNVSRLKTGKFNIEAKPVYLPDVVEDEINQLQDGARAKNLTLSFTKPKSFPTLNLDEMKIRQVVMNFTDNAIYYTPSGGKITVSLKETPKAVEFTVKDSGIGVPKEQQQKLFTKFYRADNARKARPDGTGLGLFMAKKVIVAQGGSIIFDSKEGQGSTFGFSFPREKLEITKKD